MATTCGRGARHSYARVPAVYRCASSQAPSTVQAVLAARIDRLSPDEKCLLHTAAVIGKEVPLQLLQAIAERSAMAVHDGLRQLQAAEFLYEPHLVPAHAYTFKHVLTHEVTYRSLP